MNDAMAVVGWIIAIVFGLLAYHYYRQNSRANRILLEYNKAAQALDDDWRRTGQRRGIIKTKTDGTPYIAWFKGQEPPPQPR
jgi:hypothetical protein